MIARALLCMEKHFRRGDCTETKTNHFNDCDRSFLSAKKQTRKRKEKKLHFIMKALSYYSIKSAGRAEKVFKIVNHKG